MEKRGSPSLWQNIYAAVTITVAQAFHRLRYISMSLLIDNWQCTISKFCQWIYLNFRLMCELIEFHNSGDIQFTFFTVYHIRYPVSGTSESEKRGETPR